MRQIASAGLNSQNAILLLGKTNDLSVQLTHLIHQRHLICDGLTGVDAALDEDDDEHNDRHQNTDNDKHGKNGDDPRQHVEARAVLIEDSEVIEDIHNVEQSSEQPGDSSPEASEELSQ